jgi:hypothetical protein
MERVTMGHILVSKDEIRNAILAAQRVAVELAKRAPSSVEMETYLDGFATALEVVATGLGVEVTMERPFSGTPRRWQEVWDILPTPVFDAPSSSEQNDE